VLRWTDLLSLLRHDHRWENLAEGLMGGPGMTYPITCPRCGSHRVSVENFWQTMIIRSRSLAERTAAR